MLGRRSTRRRLHALPAAGVLVLRPPRGIGLLVSLTTLLPAVLFGAVGARAWAIGRAGPLGVVPAVCAAVVTLAVSLHQLALALRQRLLVDDWGIERVGVATRRYVRWAEVARVAYNPFHHWFFVTTSGRAHLWVPEELSGIGEFAARALKRLPAAALREDPDARQVLELLAASRRVPPVRPDDAPAL
jgi:hypothetical protein